MQFSSKHTPDPTLHPDHPQNQLEGPVENPLATMRQDETIICEIQRHPIGLIAIYASFGALMLLVLVGILMAPNVLTTFDKGSVNRIGLALVIVAATFSSLFAWIATIVYNGNRWIITDDSLTQVNQLSLFDKQSSQLSLGNLEDVTSEKNGILPHIFNYGMLKVETAGERSKFVFPYCPDPDSYAQKILAARENFEQGRVHGHEQRLYRAQGSYAPLRQSSDQPLPGQGQQFYDPQAPPQQGPGGQPPYPPQPGQSA